MYHDHTGREIEDLEGDNMRADHKEAIAARTLVLPLDWPELEGFRLGQKVWVLVGDGIFGTITGIQLDTIEDGNMAHDVYAYCVCGKWYRAEDLSIEAPKNAT